MVPNLGRDAAQRSLTRKKTYRTNYVIIEHHTKPVQTTTTEETRAHFTDGVQKGAICTNFDGE